jgi:fatty acid desaturase
MDRADNYKNTRRWFFLALSVWAAAVFVAGYYGVFTSVGRIWIPPLVLAGIAIPVLVYYRNKSFRAYIWSIDLKYLTVSGLTQRDFRLKR